MNQNEYFDYLVEKIGGQRRFRLLLSFLYDEEFYFSRKIPTDINRAKDGQYLRTTYANETGDFISYSDAKMPCNILEMLVALSLRIETDIMGEPGNDHPERWFWEMIRNLGLYYMTDPAFDERKARIILENWMDRKFKENGAGGLFPIRNPDRDQRIIPIWEQMSDYLREEY